MRKLGSLAVAYLVFLGTFYPVTPFPHSSAVTNRTAPEARFALLVGINNYENGIRNLHGAENDIRLMRGVLSELYKFRPETDISELVSSKSSTTPKPTKANIEKYFRDHLIKNAEDFKQRNNLTVNQGATIVFYYSGHGSHLPDAAPLDEADGEDETIVPADSDREGSKDIRDDEIRSWFKELRRHTSNITFIFDSCHSGTVTRGGGNRSVERSTKQAPTRGSGTDAALNESMDESEDYVLISGSLPNEKAQEDLFPSVRTDAGQSDRGKNEWYGYLTYFLVQQLRESRGLTYNELMQLVSTAVTQKNPDQTPQVEGDIDRAFLGTKESRSRRGIKILEATKRGKDTLLTIDAGRLLGALPGGAVGIYSEAATQLVGDTDRIGSGRIIEASDFTAKVSIADTAVTVKAKAVLATPFFSNEKRKVAVETSAAGTSAKILARIRSALSESDYVTPIEAPGVANELRSVANTKNLPSQRDWRIAVVQSKFQDFRKDNPQPEGKLPDDQQQGFYLATPNGKPLYNFWIPIDDVEVADKIKTALELHTRVENLLALDNAANPDLSGGLKLELVRVKSFRDDPRSCSSFTEGELKRFKDDRTPLYGKDIFSFEIANNSSTDLFVYIYGITTSGEIILIYHPLADGDVLRRGARNSLFDSSTCSGVLLSAGPPYGKETFKLIATTKRFNGEFLTSPKIARDFAKDIGTRGDTGLEDLFREAATNLPASRDSKVRRIPFSGWATTKLEIEITPRNR